MARTASKNTQQVNVRIPNEVAEALKELRWERRAESVSELAGQIITSALGFSVESPDAE